QTAGVGGVPGSNVILPRQIPYNRPIYILPGAGDRPFAATPSAATPIYAPPSPFGPYGQLPLVTGGLPGYNAPLPQAPIPQPTPAVTTPLFGANTPIVGQSGPVVGTSAFATSPSSKGP